MRKAAFVGALVAVAATATALMTLYGWEAWLLGVIMYVAAAVIGETQ